MTLRLGIDTGGTFTDAVLLDTEKGILASNKALTTYHDLFIGINNAVSGLIDSLGQQQKSISMVGLSTTLATNAMVENHGRSACLVHIGQPEHVVNHPTLKLALGEDRTIHIKGGHKASGEANDELDLDTLREKIKPLQNSVAGFAIAGFFSVRNPSHELKAKQLITDLTGLPVTCSHELSSKLDAPKRALTCLFNARLIPLLTGLIGSVEKLLETHQIKAPIMVVQGDGSLVQASQALHKPVETILSGPAASLHGARYLTRMDNAIVSDIGGTTTDVAMLEDGAPTIDRQGAIVGGWHTMVEAVSVNTRGLGGDSEVLIHQGQASLSTERAIPVCQIVDQHPNLRTILTQQLEGNTRETDGKFAIKLIDAHESSFRSSSEQKIYQILSQGPVDLNRLFESPAFERALARLRNRGIVNIAAFTPTDALHVLGKFNKWNSQDAIDCAKLLCRLIERQADKETDPQSLAQKIIDLVIQKTGRVLLESTLAHTNNQQAKKSKLSADELSQILLGQSENLFFETKTNFKQPIIAIGAPATQFYPQVADQFSTKCIIPEHAHVCNAVGAATSRILQKVHGLITAPSDGIYRVHAGNQIQDFNNHAQALNCGQTTCEQIAYQNALNAGGQAIEIKFSHKDTFVNNDGDRPLFIESKLVAIAEAEPAAANTIDDWEAQHKYKVPLVK